MEISLFGRTIKIEKDMEQSKESKDLIKKGTEILTKYRNSKENIEANILENEKWYRMKHWELIDSKKSNQMPEPITAYLFSTIANKHADAMDNFPGPNILGREEGDVDEAQMLTSVVPLILENNEFKDTYSEGWWTKLKHGWCPYGVFWNNELEDGLGDIDIQALDPLSIYWQPGITDIQKSRNIFFVELKDDEQLKEEYPDVKFNSAKIFNPKQYSSIGEVDTKDQSLVVDWYYRKKNEDGKYVLHFVKFVEGTLLYSSELDEELKEVGIYDHGMYPFVFDILYPETGTPIGFGFVDILKNPQVYIDKLDQIISLNALQAGRKRFFVKDNAGINEDEFLDYESVLIHANNISEDHIREFKVEPLQNYIVGHREGKIQEMKEISGSNDFSRGDTGKGITAASAIMALQEAGNKTSRDMISVSYSKYSQVIYLVIELIRQFYDEPRKFRITGQHGQYEYIQYSNANIVEQEISLGDNLGLEEEMEKMYRRPIFDIIVSPEKQSPFSQAARNELAKELYHAGFFEPDRAKSALIALELMAFEGKDIVEQRIIEGMEEADQMNQMLGMLQEENMKLKMIVERLTGTDLGTQDPQEQPM